MSFEAKRLRVQLPCGSHTAREVDVGRVGCPFPTNPCEGGTCWFQSPPVCDFPTRFCAWPTLTACARFATPCPTGTCPFDTCGFVSPTCRWGSDPCGWGSDPCGWRSPVQCGPGTEPIDVDPLDERTSDTVTGCDYGSLTCEFCAAAISHSSPSRVKT